MKTQESSRMFHKLLNDSRIFHNILGYCRMFQNVSEDFSLRILQKNVKCSRRLHNIPEVFRIVHNIACITFRDMRHISV